MNTGPTPFLISLLQFCYLYCQKSLPFSSSLLSLFFFPEILLLLFQEEPLRQPRRGWKGADLKVKRFSWKRKKERKKEKMNRMSMYQQKNSMGLGLGGWCVEERDNSVVCPKPRRLGLSDPSFHDHHFRPSLRWPIIHQTEIGDSKAGAELLDIILTKGNCAEKSCNQVASSPPFFSGSPPSRASNPVIQDEHFGKENVIALSQAPPSPSARRGCVRMKFGHTPAPVRVEGFDCLSTDRRNCSISAVA